MFVLPPSTYFFFLFWRTFTFLHSLSSLVAITILLWYLDVWARIFRQTGCCPVLFRCVLGCRSYRLNMSLSLKFLTSQPINWSYKLLNLFSLVSILGRYLRWTDHLMCLLCLIWTFPAFVCAKFASSLDAQLCWWEKILISLMSGRWYSKKHLSYGFYEIFMKFTF